MGRFSSFPVLLPIFVTIFALPEDGSIHPKRPWYVDTANQNHMQHAQDQLEAVYKQIFTQKMPATLGVHHNEDRCRFECVTTLDCPSSSLSCFQATKKRKGCCLKALKPNETGCILDEQCRKACETSFCDHGQSPSRCMCHSDRHFLFNKCWNRCPDFAHDQPVMDKEGFSRCMLRVDSESAFKYMKRFRRQIRTTYC